MLLDKKERANSKPPNHGEIYASSKKSWENIGKLLYETNIKYWDVHIF